MYLGKLSDFKCHIWVYPGPNEGGERKSIRETFRAKSSDHLLTAGGWKITPRQRYDNITTNTERLQSQKRTAKVNWKTMDYLRMIFDFWSKNHQPFSKKPLILDWDRSRIPLYGPSSWRSFPSFPSHLAPLVPLWSPQHGHLLWGQRFFGGNSFGASRVQKRPGVCLSQVLFVLDPNISKT